MIIALIVAWIVFTILVKILKTTVSNALTVAAVIVLLQVGYGITPQDIWQQLMHLPQNLTHLKKIM